MIRYLDWDSNFFGYPVGIIELKNDLDEKALNQAISTEKNNFRLIYLFSPETKNLSSNFCLELAIKLVDEKVVYKKQLRHSDFIGEIPKEIKSIIGLQHPAFKNLALQSGFFSRYNIDSYFTNNEFEGLYEEWLKNSLNGKIADECLAYYLDEVPVGIVTLKKRKQDIVIGILAVDSNFRGLGIGTKLLFAAEKLSLLRGFRYITVATQKRNIKACQFYEFNGHCVDQVTNVYHFWNNEYYPL